jgi:hypothetical protein
VTGRATGTVSLPSGEAFHPRLERASKTHHHKPITVQTQPVVIFNYFDAWNSNKKHKVGDHEIIQG